ncbi:MAG: transglycosylase domain-containing protein [Ruminococcus sp.]|nr:transglycosylase domain-containing protein [Ruminococcus sp.]
MRKTDISKYTDKIEVVKKTATAGTFLNGLWKVLKTALAILVCAGIFVSISLGIYVFKLATEPTGIDLNARSMNLSSLIYIEDPETKEFVEYQKLYGTENRIWVDIQDMPKYMGQAVIAIEDKRFYEHSGVDWVRTGGAVLSLLSGSDSYGGSTLTQQLIKNLTYDNEVSLTRKLREIFRALNIEREYSKDDILEAYLNVVNFGNNAQGVQAASELYYNKDISECSICECAAIAGITQNPAKWNPLVYPENNKERRELVLSQMYEQKYITKDEYENAMNESETLEFVDYSKENEEEDDTNNVQNWYIDQMYDDLVRDLAKYYDISEEAASDKLYTEGLKIYCAMDLETQEMIEYEGLHINDDYGTDLQVGMTMVGFDGRVIATTGSSEEKDGNLLFDRASDAVLQPGSSIKPIFTYPLALESDIINYSGLVLDQPLEKYRYVDGTWYSGPNNAYGAYNGYMTMPEAISWSSNAGTVQLLSEVGTQTAYNQAVNLMGFTHLDPEADANSIGALSLGGMAGGVTVREMAAAMAYVGNGGLFYEPYTYYYVTDANGTVILDNRNNNPTEAYSPEVAYEMNRALRYNVLTSTHSHSMNANVSGWEIVGKTGTTDDDKDSWFVGASPYCTLAVWTGYDTPSRVPVTSLATTTWRIVMSNYLEDKEYKEYDMPDDVITATYCKGSGLLASSYCGATGTGYYTKDTMPGYCNGYHVAFTGASHSSTSAATQNSSGNTGSTASSEGSTDVTPSEGDGGTGEPTEIPVEPATTAPPEDNWVIE